MIDATMDKVTELKLDRDDVAGQLLELNYFDSTTLPDVPKGFANYIVEWIEAHPEQVVAYREILDRLKAGSGLVNFKYLNNFIYKNNN